MNKLSVAQRFSSESIERSDIDVLQCSDITVREITENRSFLICQRTDVVWVPGYKLAANYLFFYFFTILHVKTFRITSSKGIAKIQADS